MTKVPIPESFGTRTSVRAESGRNVVAVGTTEKNLVFLTSHALA